MTLLGSNLIAEQDLRVATGRDIQVLAAEETYTSYQYEKVKKSGIGAGGGLSIGYNKQERTDWIKGVSGGYAGSTVGSTAGNSTWTPAVMSASWPAVCWPRTAIFPLSAATSTSSRAWDRRGSRNITRSSNRA